MVGTFAHLATLLLLPASIHAVFDCKNIRADDQSFNFAALGGPKEVNWQRKTAPSITNTTFTVDICDTLKKTKDKPKEQCPTGTRVCGIQRIYEDDGTNLVQEVIPIAGEYAVSDGRHLDAKFTRLKGSESNEDSKKEGVRGELHGGMWEKKKQKAIIEFICDADWEGTEGFGDDSNALGFGSMSKRDDEDDGEDNRELPKLDEGKALEFVRYDTDKDDVSVLRLAWKTKYACEDAAPPKKNPGNKAKGWGFFTWFLIIVFLLAASYIIFGSWLNYNRYGARGWDLIPHGDSIRDIPYIVKDWTSSMMDKTRGGGSRGGYSAVSI